MEKDEVYQKGYDAFKANKNPKLKYIIEDTKSTGKIPLTFIQYWLDGWSDAFNDYFAFIRKLR
jgi:hypothetical protein